MGNTFGLKKTAKVMTVSGDTIKLTPPVQARDVVKDYPGFVLLESEAVKHYGVRAKPLELHQKLSTKRLYFLVELPKVPKEQAPRRVRSEINMSAKDRLESLMLSRRSASDLTIMKPKSVLAEEGSGEKEGSEATRVKVRLPKAEVERVLKESRDEAEAAERIMGLYMAKATENVCQNGQKMEKEKDVIIKPREKRRRVSFMATIEAMPQIEVTT
ncbi:uncharacterized protein At1g66480 isoform X2 [Cucurbita maxima]|uniref:Uncharacterized protein At1g66480 isoform X2 n=1 Tax=Cucurbita maxima TaxID=3661 RepID=A0A6J1JB09_CUCMA|nr:uncharacterized protein At1g66480 isoform X2 [Cucurbita maxima]